MKEDFSKIIDSKGLKTITKGAGIVFVGRIALNIVAYVYLLVLARVLGPFWLGIYALGITIIRGVSVISRMGFPIVLVRFVAIYKAEKNHNKLKGVLRFSFGISLVVSVLLSIVLFSLSKYLSINIFHNTELIKPLQVFSLSLPFVTLFFLFIATFQGLKDMKNMVFVNFLQPFGAFIFFLIFVSFFKLKIWAAVYAYIISFVVPILIGYFKLIKKLPFLVNQDIRGFVNKKEIIFYATPLFFMVVITTLFQRVDILMIGYFRTSQEIGLYTPAFYLSLLVSFPLLIFNQIFAPTIADYYHNNKWKELSYLFKTITRWIFTISFPLFLFIFLFNKEIIFLFGKQYIGASPALVVLGLAQLISASVGAVGLTLAMTARQNILLVITAFTNLLNIILNIFLIPRLGILGASIGTGISVILWNFLSLLFVFKDIKIHPFTTKFYKPFLSGIISFIIMFFICYSFPLDYKLKLGIGLLFFVIYPFIGFLFKYEKEEVFILNILKSKLRELNR